MLYFLLLSCAASNACDLCAIYDAQRLQGVQSGAFSAGVSEQFTRFGSIQVDGSEIENPAEQYLNSSVTQLYGSYGFSNKAAVQLTLPVIDRAFKRVEDGEIRHGTEFGIGDASVIGTFVPYQLEEGALIVRWSTRAGMKFPTGDAGRIKEEAEESTEAIHSERPVFQSILAHADAAHGGEIATAVHGHDLALGSGSFDFVFGTGAILQKGRLFGTLDVQYALRTEGEIDYRYADDFVWSLAQGAYLLLEHEGTAALKVTLSGEAKGMDRFRGEQATDTGITSMFLGPELIVTAFERLSGELAVDFPLLLDNTELQAVADFRIRASLNYRF